MPLAGFEPSIPASQRHQTHTSERAATAIGIQILLEKRNHGWNMPHAEEEEKLQHLKKRRCWADQEVDGKD
jgi:hypothetical protein